MPQNKRESLIYTVLMCFCMVLWMSMYNVTLHMGGFSMEVLKEGWLGFPIAYVFAMCCDWFLVSGLAEKIRIYLSGKTGDSVLKKVICVSCSMGRTDGDHHVHVWCCRRMCPAPAHGPQLLMIWLTNIPKNFIMALPFQLIIAGPLVRFIFRSAFPEGKVLA